MFRTYFDQRRPLNAPVSPARDHLTTPVLDAGHQLLLESPGVRRLIDEDSMPIPHPDDREGYYDERHLEYWLSGLSDHRKILKAAGYRSGTKFSILDVGGATGRVTRHAAQDPLIDAWLCDISINWIDWINKYCTHPVSAFQNRIFPYIQIEDCFFDAVSAFSVFTHLDVDEIPWLLEMRRILKPGGIAYVTVMDEGVWSLLPEDDWAWLRQSFSRGVDEERFSEICKKPMPGERFVWEYSDVEIYNINTVLHTDYIKRRWGQFLTVEAVIPFGHGFQTVVVLRK